MSNIVFAFILSLWIMALIFLPVCFLAWLEYTEIEYEKELYYDKYGEFF